MKLVKNQEADTGEEMLCIAVSKQQGNLLNQISKAQRQTLFSFMH